MSDRLVTVATFHQPVAAEMAKNFLESEGIPAVLFDEATVATDWMLAGAIGGIKLQVAPLHLERAEMLLQQIQAEKEVVEEEPLPQTAIAAREIAVDLSNERADKELINRLTRSAAQEIAEDTLSEREDRELINQLTDKLFRSAVFGLIFLPFVFYTAYLLMAIAGAEGTVSPNRRWKIWVSVPLMLLPMLFIRYLLFPSFPSWLMFGG